MRVLYLTFDEVPSLKGASTHILAGIRQVVREHEIILVSLGDNSLPSRAHFRHLPLSLGEKNYLRRGLLFRERVTQIIQREKPNLIHFRGVWEGVPAVRSGVPCIYEVNALPSIELRENYRHISDSFLEKIRRDEAECLSRASVIISPSELIKNCLLHEHQPRQNIHIIPNGFDRVVSPQEFQRGPVFRLVYLGTLHPWQGVLWSLPHLKGLEGKVTLDVFGPSHRVWTKYFEKRIFKFGLDQIVKHRGVLIRPGLQRILSGYDAGFAPFLRTSRNIRQGAHPLKLLDYLSAGLPVISSDVPLSRNVLDEGNEAFLFKPQGHKELISLLESLLKKDLSDSRNHAFQKASLLPDWGDYAGKLSQLYSALSRERIALR